MGSLHPQLLLDQSFEDIGCFAQAIGWDMDFRQLDSGRLDAKATVIAGQNVQLIKFQLNRGFHQMGRAPQGMLTFGVLDQTTQRVTWCSKKMPGGFLANFNRQGGFDCVSDAGFAGYAVIIPPHVLQQMAEQIGYPSQLNPCLASNPVGSLRILWR